MAEPINDDSPITVMEAIRRTASTNNRSPGTIIRHEEQLSTDELLEFIRLFGQERKLHHDSKEGPVTMREWKRFWRRMFHSWNTAYKVLVGVLSRNQAPTNKNSAQPPPSERRQGANVFLSVTIVADDMVDFRWKDARGKLVDRPNVRITVGSCGMAMAMAIEYYDSSLTRAYYSHNNERVIKRVRRLIAHFARESTRIHGMPPPGFDVPILEEPELAAPRAQQLGMHWKEVLKTMEAQRSI
ncbi:hypothetical protein FVEN_g12535 [Fusarium venenatum]|nr:hypothetical protein FVEN_g12535 [Fusarium venenatum]